ncbi:ATP-grasp domain-containing protein [Erwinia sp. E602]|uniref:ATP-grasp domain-containing protein n=1 Tax=Erwinia sp. E602 TaxID=2675378 RepID=UPI001BA764A6|nr:ATP-grasp domain-containing protein [Erwinia sp. E602]QUG76762.1 ATP-grasp domain-containing protein [Erwinia sp. E602]
MNRIVVVDGFSSGKFIARHLSEAGCKMIHIASDTSLDDYYYQGFDSTIYQHCYCHSSPGLTLDIIREFGAEGVLCGAETGVELTDWINQSQNFKYRNDFSQRAARRNKFEMIESLREAGITATPQCKVCRWPQAVNWLSEQPYPVVVKPLDSAGSDGVFICNSEDRVRSAFDRLINQKNRMNSTNDAVLLQSFLTGTEYVVNFVSLNSLRLVTEVVRYHKRQLAGGNVVYDIDEIIDASADEFAGLVAYTHRVCDCLGIENGPSHAEVMLTADGPCLVEIAARSDGILRPEIVDCTTGMGQLRATALSLSQPQRFTELTKEPVYRLKNHAFNVSLIGPRAGRFASGAFLARLQALPSFKKVEFYLADGQAVSETKDVFSQPGTVYLVSNDKHQLWRDYRVIRELEAEGIYYQ